MLLKPTRLFCIALLAITISACSTNGATVFRVKNAPNAAPAGPLAFAFASDGTLWYADRGGASIGRLRRNGEVESFPVSASGYGDPFVTSIAVAHGDTVWFSQSDPAQIVRFDPSSHAMTRYSKGLQPASQPWSLLTGPDGDVWFTDSGAAAFGRIDARGHIQEWPLGHGHSPAYAAYDGRGNFWITDGTDTIDVFSLVAHRVVRRYQAGREKNSDPNPIVLGADGQMWWFDSGIGKLAVLAANAPEGGLPAEFPVLPTQGAHWGAGLAQSANGDLYVADAPAATVVVVSPKGDIVRSYDMDSIAGASYSGFACGPATPKRACPVSRVGLKSTYPYAVGRGADGRMYVALYNGSAIVGIR